MQKYALYTITSLCFIVQTYAVVEWSGSSMPSALNENVVIKGDCIMPQNADVYVQALNTDVTIELQNNATIQANNTNNDNTSHGIYLEVLYPYTITIHIPKKLTFKGAAGYLDQSLCIYLQGNGNVQWVFEETSDAKVKFTADKTSGGTELWTRFLTVSPLISPTTPNVSFEIKRKNQIEFGARSKWGYQVFSNYNAQIKTTFEHHNPYIVTFENLSQYALEIVTL